VGKLADRIRGISVDRDSLALFWLGGASFVIKTGGNRTIYVDPYLSDSAAEILGRFLASYEDYVRMAETPIQPEEVVADLVVTTHDHIDHVDPHTIPVIARHPGTIFVGPGSCCAHFRELGIGDSRIVEINRGEREEVAQDISITGTFARHVGPIDMTQLGRDGTVAFGTDDGVGYVLNLGGIKVYHTGDTEYDDRLLEVARLRPDIVLLAANGKGGNLTPDQGAVLAAASGCKVVIPMHYGVIPITDSDPAEVVEALARHGVAVEAVVMDIGGEYVYSRQRR
jgi:L-ascorbate 6-phosphate lactonase